MRVIGITGGVGAGKSTVLSMLSELTHCVVIMADEVAKETIQPGKEAYLPVAELLGPGVLLPDGRIDKKKMAEIIFSDKELCGRINDIIHPVTKEVIKKRVFQAEQEGYDYVFVEAALLIEAGYQDICDEFWYVFVPEEDRIKRLTENRGYTREKCMAIMANQLSEEEFRKNCSYVIDNTDSLFPKGEAVKRQLIEGLQRDGCCAGRIL